MSGWESIFAALLRRDGVEKESSADFSSISLLLALIPHPTTDSSWGNFLSHSTLCRLKLAQQTSNLRTAPRWKFHDTKALLFSHLMMMPNGAR